MRIVSGLNTTMFHLWKILSTEELAARTRPHAHTDLFVFVRQLLRRVSAADRPRDAQACAHARRLLRRRRFVHANKNLFDNWKQEENLVKPAIARL